MNKISYNRNIQEEDIVMKTFLKLRPNNRDEDVAKHLNMSQVKVSLIIREFYKKKRQSMNIINIKELLIIVNEEFKVDIRLKNRKNKTVFAKKVFCGLATCLDYFAKDIVALIPNYNESNVSFAMTTIDDIDNESKILYQKIAKKHNINTNLFTLEFENHKKLQENDVFIDTDIPKEFFVVLNKVKQLDPDKLKILIETRIEPFLKMN